MRYIIWISLLSISTLLKAQDIMDTMIYSPTIEITENRLSIPFEEASKSIVVINKKQIANLPVQTLPEILQHVAGIDVQRRGAGSVQADISMRGGTFEQTLILIDGIKMNDPQTGHHSAYLPISLDDIERIEIIKGAASKTYGQNAFNGAINVVTKTSATGSITASATAGSFGTYRQELSISAPVNKYQQHLSIAREVSDGYRYNTDYKIQTANYRSSLAITETSKFDFIAGHTSRDFGANAFYADVDFIDQYEEVATSLVALKYTHVAGNTTIKPRISYRRNTDDYVFLRDNPSFFQNMHESQRLTGDINVSRTSKYGTTGLGVEFSRESLESSNLGDHDRDVLGLYLEHRISLLDGKLLVHPGLFANKFSDRKMVLLPGIDVLANLTDKLSIHANFNRSNRIPSYTDLYYNSPREMGNANLLSETQNSYEVGTRYSTRNLQISIAAYQNHANNLIDWTKDNQEALWMAGNFNSIKTTGGEFSISASRAIDSEFFTSIRGQYQLNLVNSDLSNETSEIISRYQFDYLSLWQSATVYLGMLDNNLFLTATYRMVQREQEGNDLSTPLLDAKLTYKLGDFRLFASANNITDKEYREISLVPMPGRSFNVGASYRLGF